MPHPPSRKRTIARGHADLDPTIGVVTRFSEQLAALRSERGETQKQLANRLGMTESMISRLESGTHLPSLTTLCRIARAFDRKLEISFHEHAHAHDDGTHHTHVHGHDDTAHTHDHKRTFQ